jgi:hypothetical protein
LSSQPKTRKKSVRAYAKGELNKIIDSPCHPLFQTNEGFILADGILHAMVEQNPPATIQKFIKYNLPKILEQSARKAKKKPPKGK